MEVSGGDTLAVTSAESILLETTESYDFSLELFSFAARVVLTILVELALAWLFGYRSKKTLSIIAYANIATQVILNILLNVINYKSGQWAFMLNYVWMELVIFGIEAAVYRKVIGSEDSATGKKYRPALYAFVANLMSFAVGMWIARVIPGIF